MISFKTPLLSYTEQCFATYYSELLKEQNSVVLFFNGCYLLSYSYPSQQLQLSHYQPQEPQPEEIRFPQAQTLPELLRELI